jgi:hypothetical protein
MEIQVTDPTFVEDLLRFLRSLGWNARKGDGWTVAVPLESPLLCDSCGNELAEGLQHLAALNCHDCRPDAWARVMRI